MLRGYRLYVLALGLILAAHHPNLEAQPKQPAPQERSAKALENIAATYDKQAKGSEGSPIDRECAPGDNQRKSDLCAQWKAADAATDSAWWAAVGGFASAMSTLLVLIALYLAFRSNWIARDTAKRELRAYVFPVGIGFEWQMSLKDGAQAAKLTVAIKNAGSTPTRKFQIVVRYSKTCSEVDQFPEIQPIGQYSLLSPGEIVNSPEILIAELEATACFKHHTPIYIYGGLFYEDIFGSSHETRFCFKIRFQRFGESDLPNHVAWQYFGLHNCSDEECEEQRKTLSTHHETPADVT